MSIELRKTSKRFYSRLVVNGKRRVFPLKTEYDGEPPPNLHLRQEGDAAFERSRGKALEEEENLRKELQQPNSETKLRKRVFEAMTGADFKTVGVAELFEISTNYTRERPWSDEYKRQVEAKFTKFLAFLKGRYDKVEFAHQVTRLMAEAFLIKHKEDTSCGAKTINDVRDMFKGLWTVAADLELLEGNPFRGIKDQVYISIHKEVFKTSQIEQILKESEKDPDLRSVIILALSTGMRMVDCCHLEWSSIKMGERMVMVPAQKKNMKPARIPFFGRLEELIKAAKSEAVDDKYVFPRARYLYERDKQYFTRSFSALLLRIGFTDDENPETSIRITSPDGGCRRRPLRSFHGLRTTWMTMALNGGISLEDVKKICGSVDSETIIKHYFHSDSERVRTKLMATMPAALGGEGIKDGRVAVATDELLKLLNEMNADNWEFIQQRLIGEIYGLRQAS